MQLCLISLYFSFSLYSMLLLCLLVPLYSIFSYFQCCFLLFPNLFSLISNAAALCCFQLLFFLHVFPSALPHFPLIVFLFIFHADVLSSCSPFPIFFLLSLLMPCLHDPFTLLSHCVTCCTALCPFTLLFSYSMVLLCLLVPLYSSLSYYPLLLSIVSFTFISLRIHAAALSSCSPLLCFLLFPMLFSFISKAVSINSNAVFSYLQSCCLLIPLLLLYLVSDFSCFSLYSMLLCLVSLSFFTSYSMLQLFFCSLYSSFSNYSMLLPCLVSHNSSFSLYSLLRCLVSLYLSFSSYSMLLLCLVSHYFSFSLHSLLLCLVSLFLTFSS